MMRISAEETVVADQFKPEYTEVEMEQRQGKGKGSRHCYHIPGSTITPASGTHRLQLLVEL